MTAYQALVSVTPPTPGNTKLWWSPDLFDAATGTYPIVSKPSIIRYPGDSNGKIRYYEGSQQAGLIRFWPTSDNGSAGAAYAADDKVLSDLSTATGSFVIGATGPTLPNTYDGATGQTNNEVIFDFADTYPSSHTPRALTLHMCAEWGFGGKRFEAIGYEHREYGGPTCASYAQLLISVDGGQTWSILGGLSFPGFPSMGYYGDHDSVVDYGGGSTQKTLLNYTLPVQADPNAVKIKLKATAEAISASFSLNDGSDVHTVQATVAASGSVTVYALCLEG